MLNDKDASSRRALKDLLDAASEPIPTAGATITITNSIIVVGGNWGEMKELVATVRELAAQLAELRTQPKGVDAARRELITQSRKIMETQSTNGHLNETDPVTNRNGNGKTARADSSTKPKHSDALERAFPGVRENLIKAKACLGSLASAIAGLTDDLDNIPSGEGPAAELVELILQISQALRTAVLCDEHRRYSLPLYSPIITRCEEVYDLGYGLLHDYSAAKATKLLFKAAGVVALLESAEVE